MCPMNTFQSFIPYWPEASALCHPVPFVLLTSRKLERLFWPYSGWLTSQAGQTPLAAPQRVSQIKRLAYIHAYTMSPESPTATSHYIWQMTHNFRLSFQVSRCVICEALFSFRLSPSSFSCRARLEPRGRGGHPVAGEAASEWTTLPAGPEGHHSYQRSDCSANMHCQW